MWKKTDEIIHLATGVTKETNLNKKCDKLNKNQ